MEKLDIVYTYVNSSIESWKKSRDETKQLFYNKIDNNIDSNINCRYEDNDELKYSLRSMNEYFPNVGKVFIVVSDREQIPLWLNLNNVIVVEHKDIIPLEYLPTFNSHVIELYISNIKDLSDKFLYLNDDIFFCGNCKTNDFICDNTHIYYITNELSKTGKSTVKEVGYRSAWKNANKLMNRMFMNESRYKLFHAPIIIDKKCYEDMKGIFKDDVVKTSLSRFRSIYDVNFVCSVYPYYMYHMNRAILTNKYCINFFDDDLDKLDYKIKTIEDDNIKFFCANTYFFTLDIYIRSKFITSSIYENQL